MKITKLMIFATLLFVCSSLLCATDSYALFEDLAQHGGKIFGGMREIIYAVSGFGIIAIVIGSIFGNINWRWLSAIIIGLFVIAGTAALIDYMVGSEVTAKYITDTLISGDSSGSTSSASSGSASGASSGAAE